MALPSCSSPRKNRIQKAAADCLHTECGMLDVRRCSLCPRSRSTDHRDSRLQADPSQWPRACAEWYLYISIREERCGGGSYEHAQQSNDDGHNATSAQTRPTESKDNNRELLTSSGGVGGHEDKGGKCSVVFHDVDSFSFVFLWARGKHITSN